VNPVPDELKTWLEDGCPLDSPLGELCYRLSRVELAEPTKPLRAITEDTFKGKRIAQWKRDIGRRR
jgi:hypothetical protein